ncbi:aromatic ring-hydroxylating dioxygenase subunit alpha [Thermosynechococcus sp. B0]|uniref:aromatic ring-hydroxylating oxygenase subunit alpha n=1 Tax=unclassified Thermosynechococcus TaxID=2622553 RepID=UPI002578711C|nr:MULTISPECIES: aromatic ring-hydroxylating dioxygenase subunit alpha [unclassified Thermosynechococcus]WJI22972.1 aromatic ring-hydroxylating dioxygenase subunit alpha [Thermosynechococcus sp. B0]WJI28019.1 aromatic ring-hydroxylating dioxygenase subunit alpha [Thermosynechococcus sp. B3]
MNSSSTSFSLHEGSSFLRNIWYYGLPAADLKPGRCQAKVLLGEPILFCRTTSGKPFALRNLCPHRGIPLHYGHFDGEEVECPYHGWRFNAHGHCTLIPSLTSDSDVDLKHFGVLSYPVREVQGNLWIFFPANERDVSEPTLEVPLVPGFSAETQPQAVQKFIFPGHLDQVFINFMDPSHAPFVHGAWWWRKRGKLFEKAKTFDPSPYGFTMRRHPLLRKSWAHHILGGHPEVEIIYRLPGIRIETNYSDRHTFCFLITLTPINAQETELTATYYWTFPWLAPLKPLLAPLAREFLNQDLRIVAKQSEGLKYKPPLTLIKEADYQAKWYYQLKREYEKATQEGREFVNPLKTQVLRWR